MEPRMGFNVNGESFATDKNLSRLDPIRGLKLDVFLNPAMYAWVIYVGSTQGGSVYDDTNHNSTYLLTVSGFIELLS